MSGHFKMPRGWQDHPMFQSVKREPFCHRSAWAWMIEHASFTDRIVTGERGGSVALKRGQLLITHKMLGVAWGWNTTKVSNMVLNMVLNGVVSVVPNVVLGSVVTICDYDNIYGLGKSSVVPIVVPSVVPNVVLTVAGTKEGKKEGYNKKDSRRSASVYDLEYEAFWKVCPRREAKKPAFASWKRARLTTSAEILLAAMERYAVSKSGSEQQYIALPATWLNQERWLDEETSDVYKQDRPTGPPPRPEDIWPDEFGGEVGVAH